MIDPERLSTAMVERGLTQAALAKEVGVSAAAIQQMLNGSSKRSRYLGDIARKLTVSEEWLLGLVEEKEGGVDDQLADFVEPIYLYGLGQVLDTSRHLGTVRFLDRRFFPFDISYKSAGISLVLVNQLGTDMAPTIWHDDVLLIDEAVKHMDAQDRVWVLAVGGIPLIRRWRGLTGDRSELMADNPAIPAMHISAADIEVVGRVMWHGNLQL